MRAKPPQPTDPAFETKVKLQALRGAIAEQEAQLEFTRAEMHRHEGELRVHERQAADREGDS